MNSSTQGNRYYSEEFEDTGSRWRNGAFVVLAIVGMASFFMFVAFTVGSHIGYANADAKWQASFDTELSRAIAKAKTSIVAPTPKFSCDSKERAAYLSLCRHRLMNGLTKP